MKQENDTPAVTAIVPGQSAQQQEMEKTQGQWAEGVIWDDNGKLLSGAQTYTDNTTVLKINHPLMIMVKEQRVVRLFKPWEN